MSGFGGIKTAVVLVAALTVASCDLIRLSQIDYGYEIAAENLSPNPVVIEVDEYSFGHIGGPEVVPVRFVPLLPGAAGYIDIWGHPSPGPARAALLDADCQLVEDWSEPLFEGGLLTIRPDGSTVLESERHPLPEPRPQSEDALGFASCHDAIAALGQ